jgi:hypothetical protein
MTDPVMDPGDGAMMMRQPVLAAVTVASLVTMGSAATGDARGHGRHWDAGWPLGGDGSYHPVLTSAAPARLDGPPPISYVPVPKMPIYATPIQPSLNISIPGP